MKAWAVVQDRPNASGWIGNVFHTESSAMRWVEKGNDDMRVVEIEIPDPPLEWKVGDWGNFLDDLPCRIVDIANERVVFHFRDNYVGAQADWVPLLQWSHGATPCDPPEWWEGDR